MRLTHWCPLLAVAVFLWMPQPATGQSGGYTVTATLDPVPPLVGWRDYEPKPLLHEMNGVYRGHDGYFYAMRRDVRGPHDSQYVAITQIAPTTGIARVLYVLEDWGRDISDFFPGKDGRLYFTVRDVTLVHWPARGSLGCLGGCVMYVDTAQNGLLQWLWAFDGFDDYGQHPYGLFEDTEANVYVYTEDAECPSDHYQPSYAVVKISFSGEATAYYEDCPDDGPPFDWSTVEPGNWDYPWHSSDGFSYISSGQGVYQYDPRTKTTVLLASIASSDGVPIDLFTASGYVYGITRDGGELNGGVVFRIRVPSLPSPDLVITSISDPPSIAAPGTLFNVSDTTQNAGPEPAGESFSRYYLSSDGTHADVRLTNGRYLPELWPGEESTGVRSVRIPATTPTGLYWLVVCADTALKVAESDDDNNCLASESQITVGRPDLRQISVSPSAVFASPGGKIVVSDTVDDPTIVIASPSTTRYYLSPDAARSAGDILLTGKRAIPELSPAEVNSGNATLTLPLSAPTGTYHVIACADDLLKIKEASETNNCAASSATVLVGWPDLVVTEISDPPSTAVSGGKFTILETVGNQGTITAPASYVRYYLSTDGVKNAGDVLLMGTRSVGSLASGAWSTGSRRVTVPFTPLGTYRVLACADDTSKVAENDNANNCLASVTTVTVQ
jgi:hypothetical protein